MKIKLFFLLLLFVRFGFAQQYTPMPFGNGKWIETEYSMVGSYYDHSFCNFSFDTNQYFFSGHSYRKIETMSDSTYNITKLLKTNYLFDDTINRKVYIQATGEKLLYDFSKQVGDTIRNIYCSATQTEVSFIVDSIEQKTIHGILRNVFYLRDTFSWISAKTQWIEGIGSPIGLFKNSYRCIFSDPAYALNCVHQNGIQLYGYDCTFKIVGIFDPKESLNKIQIVPNPIQHGVAYLLNPDAIPLQWTIFTIDGRMLRKGESNQLDLSDLALAVYVVRLFSEDQSVAIKLQID